MQAELALLMIGKQFPYDEVVSGSLLALSLHGPPAAVSPQHCTALVVSGLPTHDRI